MNERLEKLEQMILVMKEDIKLLYHENNNPPMQISIDIPKHMYKSLELVAKKDCLTVEEILTKWIYEMVGMSKKLK